MRLAIIGSRDFSDNKLLRETLDPYKHRIIKIISGGARGADKLGEYWAIENEIERQIFYPDWAKYGKLAGVIRNEDIINNCDGALCFWDGISKGTAHSISLCKKLNKPYRIINF